MLPSGINARLRECNPPPDGKLPRTRHVGGNPQLSLLATLPRYPRVKRQTNFDLLVQYPPFPLLERNHHGAAGIGKSFDTTLDNSQSRRALGASGQDTKKRDNLACITGPGHFGRRTAKRIYGGSLSHLCLYDQLKKRVDSALIFCVYHFKESDGSEESLIGMESTGSSESNCPRSEYGTA